MNVFILEDDATWQQVMEKMVKQLIKKNNLSYQQIYATAKPERLLDKMKIAACHHIYFLDLSIKDEYQKGFEVALEIRKKDPHGTIVFVTNHSEFLRKTFEYQIGVTDFIEKNQAESSFVRRLELCLIKANEYRSIPVSKDAFFFKNEHSSFQVPFSEILFFETTCTPHRINLVTKNKVIDFRGTLHEISDLDERLFQCHKSYVVNMENIKELNKTNKMLFFGSNFHCKVGRRMLKETEARMQGVSKSNEVSGFKLFNQS